MNDDWRLATSFADEDDARALVEALGGHEDEDERVIVSRDGATVFVYGPSEERLRAAHDVVADALAGLGPASSSLMRWHPLEQRWEDGSVPLPRTEEERERERRVRLERETADSHETGEAEWEVRVELPSHEATVELAERLEDEGYRVVRRWTYLLVGSANEDDARVLAERLEDEAPAGATVAVEPGGRMVWEVAPRNPFVVFGGLGA